MREASLPAILFVLPWQPDAAGGVNRVVLSLMEGFAPSTAYRPLLLVNDYAQRRLRRSPSGDLPAFYELYVPTPLNAHNAVKSLLAYLACLPPMLWRFIRLVQLERVAVVNLHYPNLSAFTVLLARFITFGSFRVVLSFHGADVPRRNGNYLQRLLWRFIFRHSDAIVACSHALADELRTIDASVPNLHVVHNAIDPAACRRTARQSALPQGLGGRQYVLSVGKFEDKKAHDVLIESFERLALTRPDLCLAIIGATGPALAACQRRVAASACADRILLYRDVSHGATLAAIARASIFVLPSRQEPFGIVLLEAASLGIPIVASAVGGIPEIIEHGISGCLIRPNDVQGLAFGLASALDEPQRSGARARRLEDSVGADFALVNQVLAYQRLFAPAETQRTCRAPESFETELP